MLSLAYLLYVFTYSGILLGYFTDEELQELYRTLRRSIIITGLLTYGLLLPITLTTPWMVVLFLLFIFFLNASQRKSLVLLHLHHVVLFGIGTMTLLWYAPSSLPVMSLPLIGLIILESLLPRNLRRELIALVFLGICMMVSLLTFG